MKQASLKATVLPQLRRSILSGELGPGTHVSESEIARRLNVSRAPVREAIAHLEQEGLVTRQSNRGAFVNEVLTPRAMGELASLRNLLETFALSLLGKVVAESDLEPITTVTHEMDRAAIERDWDGIAEADYRFHAGLVQLADHRHLFHAWTNVANQYWVLYLPAVHRQGRDIDNWGRNHRRIVEALVAGRPDVARMYLEFNILHSVEQLSAMNPNGHDPAQHSPTDLIL